MRNREQKKTAYIIFGANGSLGQELVNLLLKTKPNSRVFAGYRDGPQDSGFKHDSRLQTFAFDFLSPRPFNILSLGLKNLEIEKIVLINCVCKVDTASAKSQDIYDINYLSPLTICETVKDYCRPTAIEFHCVFIMSSVSFYPEVNLVHYSASKSALLNYTLSMTRLREPDAFFYGIFTGPFISRLWDEERMKRFLFTQKLDVFFRPAMKARRIVRITESRRPGVYLHPSAFVSILKATIEIHRRRRAA